MGSRVWSLSQLPGTLVKPRNHLTLHKATGVDANHSRQAFLEGTGAIPALLTPAFQTRKQGPRGKQTQPGSHEVAEENSSSAPAPHLSIPLPVEPGQCFLEVSGQKNEPASLLFSRCSVSQPDIILPQPLGGISNGACL